MRRYYILDGDKTSNGGIVSASDTSFTIHERKIAMLGDTVLCIQCNSIGRIVPAGPRLQFDIMDGKPALNKDRCACQCPEMPWLINSRDDTYEDISVGEAVLQGFGSWVGIKNEAEKQFFRNENDFSGNDDSLLEQYFEIIDRSGSSHNITFRIDSAGEKLYEAQLPDNGKTPSYPIKKTVNAIFWKPML